MPTDKIPDDVLIGIFREYIREESLTPMSITPVCRRWYNVATTTPSLWSKVYIHIVSTYTIPGLLPPNSSPTSTSLKDRFAFALSHLGLASGPPPSGLELYLTRSESSGAKVPLDITIQWDVSDDPAGDHREYCDQDWSERARCRKEPCGYQTRCQEQFKRLLMLLAGIPALPVIQPPERLKRWRALNLNFLSQLTAMWMVTSFEPLDNPICQAPNLISIGFKGVLGWHSEPNLHPNFITKLDTLSITDSFGMKFPDLTTLRRLELTKWLHFNLEMGRDWLDVPNVETLCVSHPANDLTTGFFPSLNQLHILRSIGDRLITALELGSQLQGLNGSASETRRLYFILMIDISPHSLIKMAESTYLTSAENIAFLMSGITKSNRDSIFHGVGRKEYVKALATFVRHCAEDTRFLDRTPLAVELLAEARRLNKKKSG